MNAIWLSHGADAPLYLEGGLAAAPFRGAAYDPRGGPDGLLTESLDLVLENSSPATISAGFTRLERFLTAANENSQTSIGKPVYLECVGPAGDPAYRSPLRSGWVELIGGDRARGSVGLRLHITREPWWELSAETQLKLALPGQASTPGEITLFNHRDTDAGHVNCWQVLPADISGDLPAPARIELRDVNSGQIPRVFIGEDWHPVNGTNTFLESAAFDSQFMIGGTYIADNTCVSNGKTVFSWVGSAETILGYWVLLNSDISPGQGRYFKPVLRLPGGTVYSDLWIRLRVKDINGTVIWDGPYSLIPANCELCELAPIPIPPNLVEMADLYSGLTIELLGKRMAGGSCSLAFDFMQMFPTDMFIKGIAKGSGCTVGSYLMLDGIHHRFYMSVQRASAVSSDWQVFGDPSVLIFPGVQHQFTILSMHSTTSADILRSLGVRAYYHPRKRLL
ncbi:MAG TPA: hypothetical protein VGJ97_11705 [Anaerolineaceae bacterium]